MKLLNKLTRKLFVISLIALHLINNFFLPLPVSPQAKKNNFYINKDIKKQLSNHPTSTSYAINLHEGVNKIWFEMYDGATGKWSNTQIRTITLDTIQPAFDNLSAKLNPEQVIDQINNKQIILNDLISKITTKNMAGFFTETEAVRELSAEQINGASGLGIGIPPEDFNGFVEVVIDTTKLPETSKIRLPISVLGNKNFKPTTLSKVSGITSGGFPEWLIDEFPADSLSGIVTEIRGLPK